MLGFLKNIPEFSRLLYLLSKYQLLTYPPDEVKLSYKVRWLGKLLSFLLTPFSSLCLPKENAGIRLAKFFHSLGPIYIKFGQVLSTRPDLVGLNVAQELKALQDQLPPFSTNLAELCIEKEFHKKMTDIFSEFSQMPKSAASIAQVHKATLISKDLISKEVVAVKILRPGIRESYARDIVFLEYLASLISHLQKAKRLRLEEVIKIFKEIMQFELDLRLEAAAASEMSDNFVKDPILSIPKIYWSLTSMDVLTTEWIEGVSIYEIQKFNLNPTDIATKIAVIFFHQAYRDGFFHADLHPGNILIKQDGTIALVDFGIVGILNERDRLAVAEILYGFLQRDYKSVARVHLQAGYIPQDTNLEYFARSCRSLAEPIINFHKDISIGMLLAQLFKITEDFGMQTQPQLLLLQKTMLVVEGIGQTLSPGTNTWQLAEPWIKKWAAKNLSPEAKIGRFIKRFINNYSQKYL